MTQLRSPEDGAAYWFMREKETALTSQERDERNSWLALDAANREAYQRTCTLWGELRGLAGDAPMRELRKEALEARPVKLRSTSRWVGGAVVAGVLASAVSTYFLAVDTQSPSNPIVSTDVKHYQTGIGERSTFAMKDGSTVILNTASEVLVRLGTDERTVELASGQAYFSVARDQKRPFVVIAGDQRVTALGTAFDVRVEQGSVQVVLVEGKVAVASSSNPAGRVELEPGERFMSTGDSSGKVAAANVETATSWRGGRVVFNDTSLRDAVAEINRYRTRPILIGDVSIEGLKISGTYRVSEVDRFPEAVVAYYPLQLFARPSGETVLVLRKKD